jgi:hypothetical protein
MDPKAAMDVLSSVERILRGPPVGCLAKSTDNPVIPTALMESVWKIVFGDSSDVQTGKPGSVLLLTVYDDHPSFGWIVRNSTVESLVSLLLTALSIIGERQGISLTDLAIRTLQAVKAEEEKQGRAVQAAPEPSEKKM